MFTEVEIKNFKAFGQAGAQVELGSLTILLGENGSGKTALLEAIALLTQSISESGAYGFRWKGEWLDLGDGTAAWFRSDTDLWLTLGIRCDGGSDFKRWLQLNKVNSGRHPDNFGYRVAHRGRTSEWRHEFLFGDHVQARSEWLVTNSDFRSRSFEQKLTLRGGPPYRTQTNAAMILNPNLFVGSPSESGMAIPPEYAVLMDECSLLTQYLRGIMPKRVFFLGADRGPKEEMPKQMPQDDLSVGRKGERTLSVLSLLFASPQYAQQADRIQYWAQEFGMPKLRGGFTRAQSLKAGYVDFPSQTPLNLESAGFGSQQILPVIVQLFSAPHGSLVMIEEPEISLHPQAQLNLIRMFAESIACGQQIIITTHSQTLMLALSEAAERHSMRPDDVAIYHMARGTEGAGATRLHLDAKWSLKGWVPSFSKVEANLLRKWVASVHDDIAKEER